MANKPSKESATPPIERISASTGILMVIVAMGLDFFQGVIGWLPVVGLILAPLISVFIWLTFFVWLKLHGVSLGDNIKRIAIMWGGFFVELIPVLNILPVWTLTIFITVQMVQHEDKKKLEEFHKKAGTSSTKMRYNVNKGVKRSIGRKIANDNQEQQRSE